MRRRASSSLSNASSTNSSSVLQSSRSLRAFANASSPIFSHAAIAEVEKEENIRWINNDWNAPVASTSSKILSFKRQEEEEEEEEEEKLEKVNRRQKQRHQKSRPNATRHRRGRLARNPICSENSKPFQKTLCMASLRKGRWKITPLPESNSVTFQSLFAL